MRFSVLALQSHLLRGAAVAVVAGLGAGCSSDFSRFAPTSNEYTGSINQQQIIHKQGFAERQQFPSNIPAASVNNSAQPFPAPSTPVADYRNAAVGQPMYTGSIGSDGTIRSVASNQTIKRTALSPVAAGGAALATGAAAIKNTASNTMSAARKAVTPEPLLASKTADLTAATVKKKAGDLDTSVTGTVEKAKSAVKIIKEPMPEIASVAKKTASEGMSQTGWSTSEGTWISARDGETISGLSKRFGVPANAIMAANGLKSATELQAGKKVLIPVFNAVEKPVDSAVSEQTPQKKESAPVAASNAEQPEPVKLPEKKEVAILPSVPQVRNSTPEDVAEVTPEAKAKAEQPGIRILSKASAKPENNKSASGAYTVASGDSLYAIAKKNGTTVDALKAANGLKDGNLKIGQKLLMPGSGVAMAAVPAKAAVVAKLPAVDPITTGSATNAAPKKAPVVEKMPAVEKAVAPAQEVIAEAEKDTSDAPGSSGISKLRWPVKGRTLTSYGQSDGGKVNDGVDISVPNGTPVKSAENGVVIYAGTGLKDFGNTILVKHDDGLVTVYGHAGDILVKRGQTVKRGQEIAKSGMSGNTKVPKLHFEVRKDSKPINPASYLE